MTDRYMADACTPGNIPDGYDLVPYYVDGICAAPAVKGQTRFGISSLATNAGTVGDCEPGNPVPSAWVQWVQRRRAAGVDPTIYCADDSLSSFFDGYRHRDVRQAFQNAGVPEPHYWLILLGATALPAGAVAVQIQQGLEDDRYDLSIVAAYWPGVDPPGGNVALSQDQLNQEFNELSYLADIVKSGADPGDPAGGGWLVRTLNGMPSAVAAALPPAATGGVTTAQVQAAVTAALQPLVDQLTRIENALRGA